MKFSWSIARALPRGWRVGVQEAGAAEYAGRIKVSKGVVQIERSGQRLPAPVGSIVRQGDLVITGADGSAGISFRGNSLLSVGPDSALSIHPFLFDSPTHQGAFESSLKQGTPAALSRQPPQQTPDAMKRRTPA